MALKSNWANGETVNDTDLNATADAVNAVNPFGALSAPPTSSWSTTTLGSSTVGANGDGRLFTVPSVAGLNWRIEYRTLSPTSNYTFTCHLEAAGGVMAVDSYQAAIVLRNSSSGSFVNFGLQSQSTNLGWSVLAQKWTSATAYSADYKNQLVNVIGGRPNWLRFRDNGTNRFFEYSFNGVDWTLFHSIGRTDFITPDQVGWGSLNSSGATGLVRLRSWSVV